LLTSQLREVAVPIVPNDERAQPRIVPAYSALWLLLAFTIPTLVVLAAWFLDVGDPSLQRWADPHHEVDGWLVTVHCASFAVGPFVATQMCRRLRLNRNASVVRPWLLVRPPAWSLLFTFAMGGLAGLLRYAGAHCLAPLLCQIEVFLPIPWLLALFVLATWIAACFAGSLDTAVLYREAAEPHRVLLQGFFGRSQEVHAMMRGPRFVLESGGWLRWSIVAGFEQTSPDKTVNSRASLSLLVERRRQLSTSEAKLYMLRIGVALSERSPERKLWVNDGLEVTELKQARFDTIFAAASLRRCWCSRRPHPRLRPVRDLIR
jgi:hypothetical protein